MSETSSKSKGETVVEGEEEGNYSDEFEVSGTSDKLTSAFSHELPSEDDDLKNLEDAEVDSESVLVSLMSTIQEEQTPSPPPVSIPSTSRDHQNKPSEELSENVPDELKGLSHYFEGAGTASSQNEISQHSQSTNNTARSSVVQEADLKNYDDESSMSQSQGIEDILEKLTRLTNAQSILENVMDSEGKMQESEIAEALKNALSQLPSSNKTADNEKYPWELGNVGDACGADETSLSFEMAALNKLIDDKENSSSSKSVHNSKKEQTSWEEREFGQVIKEYEELEKTLTQTNSCDEQDSIRSEAPVAAKQTVKSNFQETSSSAKTFIPQKYVQPDPFWSSDLQFLSQPSSPKSSSSSLTISNKLIPTKSDMRFKSNDVTTNNQVFQSESDDIPLKSQRSRTKTLSSPKKVKPSSTKSQSSLMRPPTPPSPLKNAKSAKTRPLVKESQSSTSGFGGNFGGEKPITPTSPLRQTPRSPRTISISSPKRRPSANSQQVQSSRSHGGGEGNRNRERHQEDFERIEKLQEEILKQESLIDAFQEDNQKLYNELKRKESEFVKKEGEWESLVNSLKTEIATIKISRLASMSSPSRPASAQKGELDRLKEESANKSQQIIELRKEIVMLRNNLAEATKPIAAKKAKAAQISQEKEKESQKTIRALNKQVRTLQKILYTKDPSAASVLTKAGSRDDLNSSQELLNSHVGGNKKDSHVAVLESRISELESQLAKADFEAKERLKDFQSKLNGLKGRYDEQLREYELQLDEASSKIHILENHTAQSVIHELKVRHEKSQVEINHLKSEISRYKRELEIAQKGSLSTAVTQATAKQDAGTLSLAIKSFKSELSEKEREIIRMKKEIADLNRTNLTLKREREKYLNLTNALSIPGSIPPHNNPKTLPRAKSDVILKPPKNTKDNKNIRSPASIATNELLQSALEYERSEFEQIIDNKTREIQDKEKMIQRLRYELEEWKDGRGPSSDDSDSKTRMLNELRSRVTAQNDLIQKLKEYISHYRHIEGEYIRLKQENQDATVEIKELKQKLELAKSLNDKPEHEILELLSRKFDELNSRYLQRERQMDSLLNRLSVRTGACCGSSGGGSSNLSPRLALMSGGGMSSGGHLSPGESEFDLRQLSPSLSMRLL